MEQSIRNKQAAALAETGGYYKHICWMALPLVCMSAYLYGPRPILLCLAALLTGNLCDRLVALLRRRVYRSGDWSNESFALVIALLMRRRSAGTFWWWRCWPACCWARRLSAATAATPSTGGGGLCGGGGLLAGAGLSLPAALRADPPVGPLRGDPGQRDEQHPAQRRPAHRQQLVAGFGRVRRPPRQRRGPDPAGLRPFPVHPEGPAPHRGGQLSGGLRGARLSLPAAGGPGPHRPVRDGRQRLNLVKYELVSGATLYSAVFLVSEPYTCPKRKLGQLLYGALLGGVSVSFRYFGVYETGVCFAILIMNSLSGWLDRVVDRLYSLPGKAGGKEAA